MARLIERTTRDVQSDRWGVAHRFARQVGMTVILKGAGTVIAAPHGPLWINMTGGPALAKGGSGDILTGMIGSLLAQGFSPIDASRAGVYLHGRAGDLAAHELGERTALARDVIAKFGDAIQSL
jgi:NAD(P)H-hydrate epimerase